MTSFSKGLTSQALAAIKPPVVPDIPEESRIVVHSAVSRFSFLYERIRNAVDYKDEHLLRRSAIRRIFQRQIALESDAAVIATNLVRELIAARYLPNATLDEKVIVDVAERIQKYLAIQRTDVGSEALLSWLRGVLSVEIEELLVDPVQEKAMVTFLYERLADRVRVQGVQMDADEIRLQIYIACYRSFAKADEDTLGFKLLRAYFPEWLRPQSWVESPQSTAERLIGVERRIKQALTHPLANRFQRAIKPWAVSLGILRDALMEKPVDAPRLLEKPEELNALVTRLAERRYRQAKTRLRRGAVRATIYLFVTKMLIAFVLEVPIEKFWYGEVSSLALGVNMLFPPTLMFIVSLFIRIQGKENTDRIKANASTLLSEEGVPLREIRVPKRRSLEARMLFGLVYAIMCVVTFGGVGILLDWVGFTWISALIFYFFLCVVSFFAFHIRQKAQEYAIVEVRERLHTIVVDFVSLPVLRAGQWLSNNISRINVFIFFFDFLFEAPFKMLLSVLEDWFGFLKEKKEELQ